MSVTNEMTEETRELSNVILTKDQKEFLKLIEARRKRQGYMFEEKQTIVNTYLIAFYINSRVIDGIGFIFEGTKMIRKDDNERISRVKAFFDIYEAIEGKDWYWVPAYGKRGKKEIYVAITNFVLARKVFGLNAK